MRRLVIAAVAGALLTATLTACQAWPATTQDVVRVPEDATLGEAGAKVDDGGIILISPGTYTDTLEVTAHDVTVRGLDRNEVILDGELQRANGVVGTGERITVENLTVRNFLQNGVLITGVTDESGAGVARGPDGYLPGDIPDPVPGYLVQYVTAQNNGLYGIYAFNRTGGEIRDNLASGGSDSGIYVGQCEACGALVADNVVQWNAVGIELANASDVVVTGNRIVENRIGISVLSNYLEAHGPTQGLRIVGNVIADNNTAATPAQASGAFGIGVGLGGTVDVDMRANRVAGNENVGVWVTSSEDFAPIGTDVDENVFDANGLDAVFSPSPEFAGERNCLGGLTTALPASLLTEPCDPSPSAYTQPEAPAGLAFSKVPLPPQRQGLSTVDETPRTLRNTVTFPSLTGIAVPSTDLLRR